MKEVKKLKDTFSVEFSYLQLVILQDLLLEEVRRLTLIGEVSVYEERLLDKIGSILNEALRHDTRNEK